jgi:hypothetical protein
MSSLFSNLLSGVESAVPQVAQMVGLPPAQAAQVGVPAGSPALVAPTAAAAAQVPGMVPAIPGQAPPPGMVPVVVPTKKTLMQEIEGLSTPVKIGGVAIAAFAAYHFLLKDKM